MGVIIGVLVVLLLVVGIFAGYISISNKIKRADLKVSEAISGIDVALTKRYDVLTKMLDVVKGYQKYELETLTKIINLRAGMTMRERSDANRNMDKINSEINLLAENYPELKSSNNFVELQKSIVDVEEHLQASRRLYNANVTAFNDLIVTFPSSFVASSMGLTRKEYFEAESYKRQDVQMTF